MKISFPAVSGSLAAALCVGPSACGPAAQAPPPVITEAFVDAENTTVTINGVGFRVGIRAGFPAVFLGDRELPVRWATESSAVAELPELRPGTYRLIARWPDGSQADCYLMIGWRGRGTAAGTSLGALDTVTTGTANTAFGFATLSRLTTGRRNTAVGSGALSALTTGEGNTGVGWDAVSESAGAFGNTAIGEQALTRSGNASLNVAVGYRALAHVDRDVTGDENIAVGVRALNRSTGSRSIAVGFEALRRSRGSGNIAIGNSAGLTNTTGSDNVYLGHRGVPGESGIIRIGTAGTHTEIHLQGRVVAPGFVPTYQPPPASASLPASGVWTDDPVRSGETPVRAVHFTELRAHVDRRRAAVGLDPFPWTDPVLTAGVTPVRLAHLLELRTALAAAYAAEGRPAPSWTDAPPGSPIQEAHLTELRTAVLEF